MSDDEASITRPAAVADKGPWPAEPYTPPPGAPTLEERVLRIEMGLWTGGEPPPKLCERARAEFKRRTGAGQDYDND